MLTDADLIELERRDEVCARLVKFIRNQRTHLSQITASVKRVSEQRDAAERSLRDQSRTVRDLNRQIGELKRALKAAKKK